MAFPKISPPLTNSANPWATNLNDLTKLFDCPYTGAITTRTSLLDGFQHDDSIHQYTFFDPTDHAPNSKDVKDGEVSSTFGGSLNTLGYSPIRLATYLAMIPKIVADSTLQEPARSSKVFIISVTGSAASVLECYLRVQAVQSQVPNPLCMEINLSCPNIPDKPPPAYSGESLVEYLRLLGEERASSVSVKVPIGIKTPPYTYHDQFKTLVNALLESSNPDCPIDFITATNTLGSSLILADGDGNPAINSASGAGIGGMAGAPLHPLALGNVRTIRSMLDEHEQLRKIEIIGVGGVSDKAGYNRMKAVGASVVGIGTALGREGVDVFESILSNEEA